MKRSFAIVLASVIASGALALTPAVAKDGDVIRRGSCSASSDWKLKLGLEDGKIEVEYEVDQNKVGQEWRVTLKHDGERFFHDVRTTKAPSGSFEVARLEPNHSGEDHFVGKAVNLKTAEECRGSASI